MQNEAKIGTFLEGIVESADFECSKRSLGFEKGFCGSLGDESDLIEQDRITSLNFQKDPLDSRA